MKKRKTGMILLVILALLVCGLLWEYIDDRHDEKLLQTVQNVDIGDGITLGRGIQAYCGQNGSWNAYDDTVKVRAYGSKHSISATFKANIKTGEVEMVDFYHDESFLDRNGMTAVVNDMVRAAKNTGE